MNSAVRTIGLTGTTGAIGQPLLKHLTGVRGYSVCALVRSKQPTPMDSVQFIHADILDANALRDLVASSEVIIHLAGRSPRSPQQDAREADLFIYVNALATAAIAGLTLQERRRFIFVSSVSVYELSKRKKGIFSEEEPLPGRQETQDWLGLVKQRLDEAVRGWLDGKVTDLGETTNEILSTHPPPDESTYALSKLLGERLIPPRSESVILRLSDVFGPPDLSSRVIPNLLLAIVRGESVRVDFGPREIVSFIYIDDVIQALDATISIEAAPSLPSVINIAFPRPTTEDELTEHLRALARETKSVIHDRILAITRPTGTRDARLYHTGRMEKDLGITHPMPLASGLRELLRFIGDKAGGNL